MHTNASDGFLCTKVKSTFYHLDNKTRQMDNRKPGQLYIRDILRSRKRIDTAVWNKISGEQTQR